MNIKTMLTVFFTILFYSCNNNKTSCLSDAKKEILINKTDMHKIELENYARRMDSIGIARYSARPDDGILADSLYFEFLSYPDFYNYTSKDIEDLLSLVVLDLQTNGYKLPSKVSFLDKVKLVFNIDPKIKSPRIRVHNNYFLSLAEEIYPEYKNREEEFEFVYCRNIFSTEYGFFLFSSSWELAYNYKEGDVVGDFTYHIPTELSPKLIHRNKYLFNDSKSSFIWLTINDSTFLSDLFVNYGYTADKNLDQWILDHRLDHKTIYDFGKAFYYKLPDNTVKFNSEVFEVFEDKIDPEYMRQLTALFTSPNFQDEYDLTFEQKAELFARLMYSAEDVAYKNQTVKIVTKEYPYYPDSFRQYIGSFTGTFKQYIDENGKYYQEFKRNNFYNLPNFEEYWQAGEDFIEMMTPPQREVEEG